MLNKQLENALNTQIKDEMFSAYLYLAMAAYCESQNLDGFAHWLKIQSDEEWEHAMKFYGYISDQGGKIVLQTIPQPPADFASPLDIFKKTLAHEQEITKRINALYELALKKNDYATQVELQWFIKEQVEEEKTAGKILEHLKSVGDNKMGIVMIDRQLASRSSE
jgi:ferritin